MYEEEEAVVEDLPARDPLVKLSTQQANAEGDSGSRNSSSPQAFAEGWKAHSLSNVGKLRNMFSGRSRPKTTSSGTLITTSDSESRPMTPDYHEEAPEYALGDRPSSAKMSSSDLPEDQSSPRPISASQEKLQQSDEFNITPSRLSEELRLNSQKLQQLGSIIEWKDRRIARLEDSIRKLEATKDENSGISQRTSTDNATETPAKEHNEQSIQVSPDITDNGSDGSSSTESEVAEEVEKLRCGLMDKDCKLQAVKSDLWGVTIEYEQLEEKFDQVRHDLDKAFHDLDSTRKDVQVFRKKTESLEARKFHLEEVLQVKDLQIQQLMLQVNNSANDRADMSMCFSQIDQHIHNLEDSFAQKSFSMAQLEEEISRLRFVLDEGAAREKCVQEELHRKCKLVDQREGELRHVYEQLANQENMRVELNGALESRQHELGELKEKLQASFVNTEDLCRRLHEKETDYCEMKREMWILRERNSGLERINMENTHQHTFQNEPSFGNYTENPNLYDKQGKDQREEHSDVCDVETDPHQYAQVTEYANMHTNTENHHTDTMNEPEVSQQDESYVLSLEAELHVAKILNAALEEEEVEEPWAMVERNDSGSQAEEEMACCRWSASGDGVVCTGKNDGSNKWTDAFDELLERSWSALENLEHVQQEPDFGGDLSEGQFEDLPPYGTEPENKRGEESFVDPKEEVFWESAPPFSQQEESGEGGFDVCNENGEDGFLPYEEGRRNDESFSETHGPGESELGPVERHEDYRLRQIINFLEEEKAVLEKDLKEAYDKSCWFEQENQRLSYQLNSMGDYNRELEGKLQKLGEEHRNVQHDTEDARAQLKGIISTLSEYHEKAARHTEANQGQLKRLQEELDEALESEHVLKDSLAQKLQELHDLSENFESFRHEHQQVCNDMGQMKDELRRTSGQFTVYESQLEQKNKELQQRSEELLRLRQSVEELDNMRTNMENGLSIAREKMQALEELSDRNSQQIVEAEQEIEVLASSKSDLEAQLRKSDGQLQQALNDVQFFRDQLNTLEREKAQLEEQSHMKNSDSDQDELEKKTRELENVLCELESTHGQVNQLTERLRQAENELHTKRDQEQGFHARIEELQIDRVAVAKELSGVDAELEKLRSLLEIAAKSNGLDERELWSARSSGISSVQEPVFVKAESHLEEATPINSHAQVAGLNNGREVPGEPEPSNFEDQASAEAEHDRKFTSEGNSDGRISFDQRSQLELAQAEIAVLRSENVNLELKHSHVEAVIEKQHEALMAAANDLLAVRENLQRDIKEMRDVTRLTILKQDQQLSNLRKEFSRSSMSDRESKLSRSSFAPGQSDSDSVVRDLMGFCDATMRRMADENKKCQSVMGQLVEKHTEMLQTMRKKLRRMDQSDKSLKVLDDGARSYIEMASELKSIISQLSNGGSELTEKSSETTMKNLQKHLQQLNGILALIKAKKSGKVSAHPETDERDKETDSTSSSSSSDSFEKEEVRPAVSKPLGRRHSHLPSELEELCGRLVRADKELRVWRSQGSVDQPTHRRKVSFVGSSGDSATSTSLAVNREEPACTCTGSRKQAGGDVTRSSARNRGGDRSALGHESVRTDRGRRD